MQAFNNSQTPEAERDTWRTPGYLVAYVRYLLGGIDFDTACTAENAVATPIVDDTLLSDNALLVPWRGRCFCNPPYSDVGPWVEKAASEPAMTALLIPAPDGQSYYALAHAKAHEINIVGRIAFINVNGEAVSGNNRGSSLFIFNGYGQGARSSVRRDDLIDRFGGRA